MYDLTGLGSNYPNGKTMKNLYSILLIFIITLGCTRSDTTIPKTQAEVDLDISELVFRYQFENNASGAQGKAAMYCLELFGQNPTPDFMERFDGHLPPVEVDSKFKLGEGLVFRIEKITRVNEAKIEVEGGYYEGGLSSSGCTYTVVKTNGEWQVTSHRLNWIS